jgi:hypothetical protein
MAFTHHSLAQMMGRGIYTSVNNQDCDGKDQQRQ